MAFLIPAGIELAEVVAGALAGGEAAYAAVAGSEAAAVAAESEAVAQTYPMTSEALEYDDVAMQEYEDNYLRIPIENPEVVEGYPDEGVSPNMNYYYGDTTSPAYRLVRSASQEVENLFSRIRNDPATRHTITVGAGKALFVAGFWYFLDPLTGAPVYAIAGDDPRVRYVMESLGYTQNAREYGLAIRTWFSHLFGDNENTGVPAGQFTLPVSGNRRRPIRPRDPVTLPSQSLLPSVVNNGTMAAMRRKRPRTEAMMVPAVSSSSRPMVLYKSVKSRRSRIMTVNRTLARFVTFTARRDAGTGGIWFGTNAIATSATSATADTLGYQWGNDSLQYTFRLADFNEYTDLKSAFDQYRIKSATVMFIPQRDEASIGAVSQGLPTFIIAEDRDDINNAGAVSGPEKLSSKQGSKFFRLDEPFTFRAKPCPWTGAANAREGKTKVLGGWIPTTNDVVQHYGIKLAPIAASMISSTDYNWTFVVKINVECKHQD